MWIVAFFILLAYWAFPRTVRDWAAIHIFGPPFIAYAIWPTATLIVGGAVVALLIAGWIAAGVAEARRAEEEKERNRRPLWGPGRG